MPLVKVKTKYQITLPTELREVVGLEVGDLLEATAKKNTILLNPKVVVDRDAEAGIEQGLRDLRAGRTTPAFRSVKEFKAHLKKR